MNLVITVAEQIEAMFDLLFLTERQVLTVRSPRQLRVQL